MIQPDTSQESPADNILVSGVVALHLAGTYICKAGEGTTMSLMVFASSAQRDYLN